MTVGTAILLCLVALFVAAAIGGARSRDPLHILNAILAALVLALLFTHGRVP